MSINQAQNLKPQNWLSPLVAPITIDFKNNSFDFIRLFLALLVVVSHASYYYGTEFMFLITDFDRFNGKGQLHLGTLAVYGFFVVSGFLITASFCRTQFWWEFVYKRCIRIFPAFWVSLVIIGLGFAPFWVWGRTGALDNYIGLYGKETWLFLTQNLTTDMIHPKIVGLEKNDVNGPYWTLILEFRAYLMTVLIGFLGFFSKKYLSLLFFLQFNFFLVSG
jgi:peptidoglycan/LPS O-acetylase OafA/YrhL